METEYLLAWSLQTMASGWRRRSPKGLLFCMRMWIAWQDPEGLEQGHGYWPVLTWQPTQVASAAPGALLTDRERRWVRCIIQRLEALTYIVAWRLYAAGWAP